jgi:hypothetical protein
MQILFDLLDEKDCNNVKKLISLVNGSGDSGNTKTQSQSTKKGGPGRPPKAKPKNEPSDQEIVKDFQKMAMEFMRKYGNDAMIEILQNTGIDQANPLNDVDKMPDAIAAMAVYSPPQDKEEVGNLAGIFSNLK